jgi:hypothetical protein
MPDLCVSCGATAAVAMYLFERDNGELVDRLLCPDCVPPQPMPFAEWLDWAWQKQQRDAERPR